MGNKINNPIVAKENRWSKFTLEELIEIQFSMEGFKLSTGYSTQPFDSVLKEITDLLDGILN